MIGKPDKPTLEGWTTIAVLASITIRIKLVTPVTGILYRYPTVLAKIAATLYNASTCHRRRIYSSIRR
jgi:alkanesulfonate monooxygenase SsuD/methylene tetrahydromethanopterin reductase-like flavin-dependent oxidoreductase (luciferase family)